MSTSSGGGGHDPHNDPHNTPIPLQDLTHTLTHTLSDSHPRSRSASRSRSLLHHGADLGRRLSTHLRRRSSYDRLEGGGGPEAPLGVPDLQVPSYGCGGYAGYGGDGYGGDEVQRMRGEVDEALGSVRGRGSWLPGRKASTANSGREREARSGSTAGASTASGRTAHLSEPVTSTTALGLRLGLGLGLPPYGDDDDDDNDGYGYGDIGYAGGGGVRGSSGSGGVGGVGGMGVDDDSAPLADNQAPIAGTEKRLSTQSVRFAPGTSLGDDLHAAEEGLSRSLSKASGSTRSGSFIRPSPSRTGSGSRSLSPGASPVRRVSMAVQNMSQRVVNLSNDPEAVEQTIRRKGSNKSYSESRRTSVPEIEIEDVGDGDGGASGDRGSQLEKPKLLRKPSQERRPWREQVNPLKGNTLRIFSPTSRVRLILCDVLIHPAIEPLILLLILVQTILLTIDSAPSVFDDPRAKSWGTSPIDYALLVLFSIYTIEIVARCIVSGVFMNPVQEDDPEARGGLRRRIVLKAKTFLTPKRVDNIRAVSPTRMDEPPSLMRSITQLNMAEGSDAPGSGSIQSQARFRLARRAFLRHSFNRLDFVAVISYWISLGLCVSGLEAERHLYVFRMMSCLRILRLLGITSGTSVILRSLKKAAPLLVHVAFLIGFFWLVFAVIGVQSFKGSLERNCVWVDPEGLQPNYTQEFQFCGGYMDPLTGRSRPFLLRDGITPGAKKAKGYICPPNSLCMVVGNPYAGTVSFDNIVQSLELVFVVMTANTFSDLLYYTADSDYLAASCFFIAAIIILAFWLANLLIAVITSSFQVIREESSKSAFSADDVSSVHNNDGQAERKPSTLKKIYDLSRHLWIVVIGAGLFAQTFRSARMREREERMIDRVEASVTLILLFEIIFRFVSDWRGFHTKRRNWVDLFLAVITCIILLPPVRHGGRIYDWLTAFQILRVYRLVWAIPVTRNLLAKVLGNVSGLFNLIFFVILLTFLCALFAVQIVRGDIPAEIGGETTPVSFFTIFNAFLGMYQVFSSEDWTSLLYMATEAQQPYGVGWISAMFFIGWFILGNFIVLNMFIAVIQENFDVTEDEKRMHQVKAFLQNKSYRAPTQGLKLSSLFSSKKNKMNTEAAQSKQAAFEMLTKQAIVESFLDEGEHQHRQDVTAGAKFAVAAAVENLQMQEEKRKRFYKRWFAKAKGVWRDRETNPFYSFQSRSVADLAPTALAQEVVTEAERRKRAQREYLAKHPNYNVSLFIFGPQNPIRRMCQRMVGPSRANVRYAGLPPNTTISYAFSIIIYCAIVAMVVLACFTTPLYQKEYFSKNGNSRKNWFTLVDAGFVVLFTFESAIKIIADGLIWTPNAYLRGSWGIIDCIVLITLWISVASSLTNKDEISRAVGAFKALRALRLLNISGTAQDTFHSVVILGGKKILSAAFVSLSLIIPFAIYGVNLFAGQMDACNDGNGIVNLTDCIHEYASQPFEWDVLAPRVVENPYFNFDDFGTSLFILFQIVSQEGWTGVMFNAQNVVGKGMQPQPFHSQVNSLFFLVFNLLGAVFVLTLFVSVFMRNYTEQTGVAFLTADQRTWLELRKLLRQVSPSKRPDKSPDSEWKGWCYQRATHKHGYWQRGVTVLLMIHGLLLLLEYHPSPGSLDRTRDWLFLVLNIAFIGNLAVRVVGLTWSNFIKSKWDIYALLSVSGTFVTTLLLLAGYANPMFVQLQKLFLVSVVIMLIPRNDQLDHLFKTAAASLTSIGNLIATWFVLFLVYAIALTQTFGLTKIGPNGNGNMNFRTVPKALILLFRMTCGEGWNEIMSDYEVIEPACVRGQTFFDSDCGSEVYAHALFVSWNILSMYIFVSMFISLIFESFSYVYQRSGDSSQVSREEIRKFKQAWATLDPDGTGYIAKDRFPRLLGLLSGIFAMRVYEDPFTVHSILDDCRVDPNSAKGRNKGTAAVHGIDLDKLNRRIAQIPVHKIRRQRHTFTLFFEECLVSADKDYGVSFESVLLILAHYKLINDNKSLRLEEYLRRRYRLQRVEEQVQRNVVTNFFLTLYWSKRFKDLRLGRITPGTISRAPSTTVPQIRVDNASDITDIVPHNSDIPQITLNEEGPVVPPRLSFDDSYHNTGESSGFSPIDSPTDAAGGGAFSFGGVNPFSDGNEPLSFLRQRGPGRRTPPYISTPNLSPSTSPMISPALSPRVGAGPSDGFGGIGLWYGAGAQSPTTAERQTSEVAPQVVMDALDDSEWRDQIRSFIESQIGPGAGGSPSVSRNGSRNGEVSRQGSRNGGGGGGAGGNAAGGGAGAGGAGAGGSARGDASPRS